MSLIWVIWGIPILKRPVDGSLKRLTNVIVRLHLSRTCGEHDHVAQHRHETQPELRSAGRTVQLRQNTGSTVRHQSTSYISCLKLMNKKLQKKKT